MIAINFMSQCYDRHRRDLGIKRSTLINEYRSVVILSVPSVKGLKNLWIGALLVKWTPIQTESTSALLAIIYHAVSQEHSLTLLRSISFSGNA